MKKKQIEIEPSYKKVKKRENSKCVTFKTKKTIWQGYSFTHVIILNFSFLSNRKIYIYTGTSIKWPGKCLTHALKALKQVVGLEIE